MVFAHQSFHAPRGPRPQRAPRLASLLLLLGGMAVAGCASGPGSDVASVAPEEAAVETPAGDAVGEAAAKQAPTFAQLMDRHDIPFQPPAQGKSILVNIPGYELIAFEDGEPVMRSRVIVGRDREGDRTPEMTTHTSVVRFRPTWRPTPMMIESGAYEDRVWPPGENNPLGLLAIRLEPGMLIYLHGTNKPELFERESRALSSGCVRVERWDEVAAWVLGITVDQVHEAAEGGATFDMDTTGVPVFMRYFPDFPDADGQLQAHADVYDMRPEPSLTVAQAPATTPATTPVPASASTAETAEEMPAEL